MVNVLALNVVDPGFEARSGQTKDYKIGMSPLNTQHQRARANTGWFGIRVERHVYPSTVVSVS